LNILIISQYFWPENFKINDFAVSMAEKGHKVSVLTGIPNYPNGKFFKGYNLIKPKFELYKGIEIFRSALIPRGRGNNFRLILNYFSFAFFASFAALFRLKEKFDVVFVFEISPITVAIPAIFYKKCSKIPICLWVLDLWPENIVGGGRISSKLIYGLTLRFVKYVYKKMDKIFVQSKGFIDSIAEKGVSVEKIEYLPNWAEDVFKPVKNVREELKKKVPEGFIVMFAGNIGESQDFECIIKAAVILKEQADIHFVIIGDGRKRAFVEREISQKKLDSNFHLIGQYPLDYMPEFYQLSDVMLVSLKKNPIFAITIPAKVQSYLACGKPIVAALEGEGEKIINESSAGLCSNSGNYKALAENIVKLRNIKSEKLDELGQNALKYYKEHFERNTLINKAEEILKSLITR